MFSYRNYEFARKMRGMSDNRVAREAKINAATLYAWRDGRYEPKMSTIMRIAAALGVNATDLMDEQIV